MRYYLLLFSLLLSLASKAFYSISPYAWCGNNPVRFVDPNGHYFDEANEEIAQQIEDSCNTILSTSTDGNQIEEVKKTLDDIQKMREDKEREYQFGLNPEKDNVAPSTQCTGINADGHQVILMTSNSEQINDALFHEVRHGGQIARRELLLDGYGVMMNYGVRKEIDAYKAQWGRYGTLSLLLQQTWPFPTRETIEYSGINVEMVESIVEKVTDGYDYVYPPKNYCKQLWRQN